MVNLILKKYHLNNLVNRRHCNTKIKYKIKNINQYT